MTDSDRGVPRIFSFGADDGVYDALLLLGPLLWLLIVIFGRNVVTIGLAGGYVAGFLLYTLYNGLRWSDIVA